MQVTSIFGSSMEVFICVDGETSHGSGRYSYVGSDGAEAKATVGSSSRGGAVAAAPGFHCGSAFATIVSVAGPWPPVAVPVPFRLEAETPEEKLRCEVCSSDAATIVTPPLPASNGASLCCSTSRDVTGKRRHRLTVNVHSVPAATCERFYKHVPRGNLTEIRH